MKSAGLGIEKTRFPKDSGKRKFEKLFFPF